MPTNQALPIFQRTKANPQVELVFVPAVDWFMPTRILSTSKLVLIERGRRIFQMGKVAYTATAGDVILLPPGVPHTSRPDRGEPASVRTISLPPGLVAPPHLLPKTGCYNFRQAMLLPKGMGTETFLSLYQRCAEATCAKSLHALIQAFLRRYEGEQATVLFGNDATEHQEVARAKAYLDKNFQGTVSLADLAAVSHLSGYHLHRLFVHEVGLTPHQYQINARVNHAQTLLTLGTSVADVAAESGFYDHAHLGRHFARYLRTTPTRYRIACSGGR